MPRRTARRQVVPATTLPKLAGASAALSAGEISFDPAPVIWDGAAQLGVEPVAQAEPILLEAAAMLDSGRLRQVVTHLRHIVAPPSPTPTRRPRSSGSRIRSS